MNRKNALQTIAIVIAGVLLALIANAFASRDRKMTLVGSYPNATTVPARDPAPIAPIAAPPSPVVPT
ncbi:MAG: hypothetical protein ACREMY_32625, partial [bacterium]